MKIYVKQTGCAPCMAAKHLIEKNNIQIDILQAEDHVDFLKGNGLTEMPVLISEGETFTGRDVIKYLMSL